MDFMNFEHSVAVIQPTHPFFRSAFASPSVSSSISPTNAAATATTSTSASVSGVPASSVSATNASEAIASVASVSVSASASATSSSQSGPFQIVYSCRDCGFHSNQFATEREFRTHLSKVIKEIQQNYSQEQSQNYEENPLAGPTDEEVAAVVSSEMPLDEAVRKTLAWRLVVNWSHWLVQEIVQPTEANPRAVFREMC